MFYYSSSGYVPLVEHYFLCYYFTFHYEKLQSYLVLYCFLFLKKNNAVSIFFVNVSSFPKNTSVSM